MSDSLITAMARTGSSLGSVEHLSEAKANDTIEAIAKTFRIDRTGAWWWQSLSGKVSTIGYGEAADPLRIIPTLVDPTNEVYLLVTDDEPPPWPGYRGRLDEILELIGEQWRFEFLLAPIGLDWLLFDTHHNEIVITGSLAEAG